MNKIREKLFTWGMAIALVGSVALAQGLVPEAPTAAQPVPEAPPAPAAVEAPPAVELPARAASAQRRLQAAANGRNATTAARRLSENMQTEAGMAPGSSAFTPAAKEAGAKTTTPALKFEDSTADFLLRAYADETGKTLLIAPDVPKVTGINLRSQEGVPLTKDEYLEAIEVTLSMNGILLETYGEKFLKVLPRKTIRTEGIRILMDAPHGGHPEKTRVVSQMIQLKSITISEAQKALEGFKRPDGLIQAFERTNSLLVTDTQENVNRMLEIVQFIDQPLVATEEVNVRMIRFAKADDIKKRLEEIVAESQKQSQSKEEIKANVAGAPGFTRGTAATTGRPLPPGLTRLGARASAVATPAAPEPNLSLETLVSDADRGMIRGKVQIVADERSNQLIIITREENMAFFDKIITVLDVETAPDVKVEVRRLEYADAEEVSTMLNDLIGNASSKKEDSAPAGAPKAPAGDSGRSTSLAEAVAARAGRMASAGADVGEAGKSKLGQLSKDNIKILADKRTNAIVMMGSPNDLAAINEVIKGMDIRLSQVLIETVVLEVNLGDEIETGIDWVKRVKAVDGRQPIYGKNEDGSQNDTIIGYTDGNSNYRYGVGGGGGGSTPVNLFGADFANPSIAAGNGLNYFSTIKGLNLDLVIKAAANDSRTTVLSSPVLLTVDNKEATIESTEMRYLLKGFRYSGSSYQGTGQEVPDYEQRDFGLTVKVTPRINPNGTVVMNIEKTYETEGDKQSIQTSTTGDGSPIFSDLPTINKRKIQADVSVENRETVILGGLVKKTSSLSKGGIPLLRDIPYIGPYLFGKTLKTEGRTELLVFLTPYVLDSPEDVEKEMRRRKESLSLNGVWTQGWSDSKLADPESVKEKMEREKRKWALDDEERRTQKIYDKALKQREEKLQREEEKERDKNAAASSETAEKKSVGTPSITIKSVTDTTEVIEPAIQVSESVEVLGPKDATAANKAAEPSERLLTPEQGSAAAEPKAVSGAKVKKPWWQMF